MSFFGLGVGIFGSLDGMFDRAGAAAAPMLPMLPLCGQNTVFIGVIAYTHPGPTFQSSIAPQQEASQCLTLALALALARSLHDKKSVSAAEKGGVEKISSIRSLPKTCRLVLAASSLLSNRALKFQGSGGVR